MKTLITATLVATMALAAGASALASDDPPPPGGAPPAPQRTCFFSHEINGWHEARPRNDRVIYLDVGANDVYRLDTFGPCGWVNDALSIGVQTTGGSDSICSGLDVTLIVRGPTGPYRCPVSKITKLTPEEAKALSGKKHP